MTHPRHSILSSLLLTVGLAGCEDPNDGGTASATEPEATSTAATTTAATAVEPTGGDTSGPPTSTGEADDDTTTSTGEPEDGTSSAGTSGGDDGTTTAPVDETTSTGGTNDDTTTTGTTSPDDDTTTTTTGTTGPDDDTTTGTTGSDDDTTTGGALECDDGVAWVRHIPNHAKFRLFHKVVVDAQENVYAVGNFWQTAEFGGGPLEAADPAGADGFLVKYGPQGEHLWDRQFGGVDEQWVRNLALAGNGDIVVVGKFRNQLILGGATVPSAGLDDGFVARLDPGGTPLWVRTFGNAGDDEATRVAVDGAGNIVFTARSTAPLDLGGGPLGQAIAAHVVKLDPAGALVWHRAYDAKQISTGGLGVGPDDAVVVTGVFSGTTDFGGGPVKSQLEGNVYVLKLDPKANYTWSVVSKGVGEYGTPNVAGLAIDGAGRIHLGGYFTGEIGFGGPLVFTQGQLDAWLATLSPGGAPLSISGHGSGPTAWQMIADVAVDAAGRTAVAGSFQDTITFGDDVLKTVPGDKKYDVFAARFDESGAPVEARGFGAPGDQFGNTIALGADGSTWLAGNFTSTFQVGDVPLIVTENDGFIARLCP